MSKAGKLQFISKDDKDLTEITNIVQKLGPTKIDQIIEKLKNISDEKKHFMICERLKNNDKIMQLFDDKPFQLSKLFSYESKKLNMIIYIDMT